MKTFEDQVAAEFASLPRDVAEVLIKARLMNVSTDVLLLKKVWAMYFDRAPEPTWGIGDVPITNLLGFHTELRDRLEQILGRCAVLTTHDNSLQMERITDGLIQCIRPVTTLVDDIGFDDLMRREPVGMRLDISEYVDEDEDGSDPETGD